MTGNWPQFEVDRDWPTIAFRDEMSIADLHHDVIAMLDCNLLASQFNGAPMERDPVAP